MTAPDTQDTTALWWEALQVMGRTPQYDGDTDSEYIQNPLTMGHDAWKQGDMVLIHVDHWNLFGLAVEWIEARMKHPGMIATMMTTDGKGWGFSVVHPVWFTPIDEVATTLPEAAARWIVEHGPKIAKEPMP